MRDGEGFVLVYSITSRSSFEQAQAFHSQVWHVKNLNMSDNFGMPILLVGSNCERDHEREVSSQEGSALARILKCQFLEVSTEEGINIEKAFFDVVRMIRQQKKEREEWRRLQLSQLSMSEPDARATSVGVTNPRPKTADVKTTPVRTARYAPGTIKGDKIPRPTLISTLSFQARRVMTAPDIRSVSASLSADSV